MFLTDYGPCNSCCQHALQGWGWSLSSHLASGYASQVESLDQGRQMMKLTIATHPQETPGTLQRGLGCCMGSLQAHPCFVGFADDSVTPITAFCFCCMEATPTWSSVSEVDSLSQVAYPYFPRSLLFLFMLLSKTSGLQAR